MLFHVCFCYFWVGTKRNEDWCAGFAGLNTKYVATSQQEGALLSALCPPSLALFETTASVLGSVHIVVFCPRVSLILGSWSGWAEEVESKEDKRHIAKTYVLRITDRAKAFIILTGWDTLPHMRQRERILKRFENRNVGVVTLFCTRNANKWSFMLEQNYICIKIYSFLHSLWTRCERKLI